MWFYRTICNKSQLMIIRKYQKLLHENILWVKSNQIISSMHVPPAKVQISLYICAVQSWYLSSVYSAIRQWRMYRWTGKALTRLQGPVVQSVVSITTSLRVISLTVLADPIHNILIFFAEKMWVAFALQKLLTFSKKLQNICVSLDVNFNESLTNDVVSFEQLGPDV